MKTILVTGGNRGIGLEICRQLAVQGHRVILCSRDPGKGIAAAQSLGSDHLTGSVIVKQLDVTDEASVQALYQAVRAEFGKLDVLINNAGVGSSGWDQSRATGLKQRIRRDFPWAWRMVKYAKPVLQRLGIAGKQETASNVDLSDVKRIMETNFYGPWRMIQVFAPLLQESDDPGIINISSGLGELESLDGRYPGYSLSKSSLNALTVMFANELKKKGIRVNAMCPGWVRTDMGGPDAPRDVSEGADTAVWLATAQDLPTGKFFRDRKEISW